MVRAGGEGAIAFVEQHFDVPGGAVGDGEIELAIAVEIPHRHRGWLPGQRVLDGGGEGAVALAEEHAQGLTEVVGDHEIELPVAVEVPRRQRLWKFPRGRGRRPGKSERAGAGRADTQALEAAHPRCAHVPARPAVGEIGRGDKKARGKVE